MQRRRVHRTIACHVAAFVVGAIWSGCVEEVGGSTAAVRSSDECGLPGGTGCAPASERVDLYRPTFSSPTEVHNPLFPISDVHSAVMLGLTEGEVLRIEVTLLPATRTIKLRRGQRVPTLVSQFVSFVDGRIHEVALDHYAQDDLGAAWYFGEDVFNYEDGEIADTEGTWLAGRDGPPAMIMPADPQVGDVYRPENIPGLVFEEVTVLRAGVTVEGPRGPVAGAIVVQEHHMDGILEEKQFAPGYGEFFSGAGEDFEAMALAVPTDASNSPPPEELDVILDGADAVFESEQDAGALVDAMIEAWNRLRSAPQPPRLVEQMDAAMESLAEVAGGDALEERMQAALDVARAALDFELRYAPPVDIDLDRFELWLLQVLVDEANDDAAGVAGDVATLEWVLDRFAHTLDGDVLGEIEDGLDEMGRAAAHGDLETASEIAEELHEIVDEI